MEIWRSKDGSEIAVRAATWELNPKVTFQSLAPEFRRNPTKAWRNFGSIVDQAIEGAIKERDAVVNRINRSREMPWDLVREQYKPWFRGARGVRYFGHFDLSKNRDATGFAIVHRERDGRLVADFMLQYRSKNGKDINFGHLRELLVYPLLSRGFHLQCVSFDGFQSDETRQVLEERGIHTDYCSADKSPDAYDTLIDYLLTDRFDFYSYPIFIRELEELRLYNGLKYDHPRRFKDGSPGSKDVADAVACAALMAVRYALENPATATPVITVHRQKVQTYGERSIW